MKQYQGQTRLFVLASAVALNACAGGIKTGAPWQMPETVLEGQRGHAYPANPAAQVADVAPLKIAVPYETENLLLTTLEHNPAIQIAESRHSEAIANKQQIDAGFMPKVSLSSSTTRRRQGNENTADAAVTSHTSRGGADLSIPIDIFGALSSSSDAAGYRVTQSAAELEDTRLRTVQDVVLASIDAAEQNQLQTLNITQLNTNRTSLKLTEFRYTKGQADIVDVLQQKDLVASLEQEAPALVAGRRNALDTLAVLAGRLPGGVSSAGFKELPEFAQFGHLISPEGLLTSRPDMRALKAGLDAADSRLSVAIKDRLPSFEFSGSAVATLASGDISSVISGTLSAALTLFDGGAKRAVVSARRVELERSGAVYIEAWLNAVVEVDGLIAEEQRRTAEYELAVARLDNARKLHKSAERRYRLGASDYLPVLSAKRTIEQQERSLLTIQASLMRARVRLHTAMGGQVSVGDQLAAAT